MRSSNIMAITIACAITLGCGKKDNDNDSDTDPSEAVVEAKTPPTTNQAPELNSGNAVVGYALSALSSATIGGSSAALALEETASEKFPGCSLHGEPWDDTTGKRMDPSNDKFAGQTFRCQLTSNESVESVRGAFQQNKNILCDIERVVGSLVYEEAGKVYETVIMPTVDCGWAQHSVDEITAQSASGIPATVTATALTSGDWQKKLHISATDAGVNFTLYITANATTVAFKQVDTWSQADRGDDKIASLADDATGISGGVISIDIANGTMRAETFDTYWGRRTRMLVKGTIDSTTGEFSAITAGEGLQGNFQLSSFDNKTGLYGEIASVKGDSASGYKFNSARYSCDSETSSCNAATSVSAASIISTGTECSDGTCEGNAGITIGTDAADFAFWKISATWDNQNGGKSAIETWLNSAGLPIFDSVTKDQTL